MTGRQRILPSAGTIIAGSPIRRWKTTRSASPPRARGAGPRRASPRPPSARFPSSRWKRSAAPSPCRMARSTPSPRRWWSASCCSLTGLPIARYASRYGVDIDLLTRGAGFGYIGSTVTSLIYATFTFILFAIEASIMTTALEIAFGIPTWLGYILSAAAVIPLVTHGNHLDQPLPDLHPAALDLPQPPAGRLHPLAGFRLGRELVRLRGAGARQRTSRPRHRGAGGGQLRHSRADAADRRAGRHPALSAGRRPRRAARPHRDAAGRPPAGSSSARQSCCSARSWPCWRCAMGCRSSTRPNRRECMSSPSAMCCPGPTPRCS